MMVRILLAALAVLIPAYAQPSAFRRVAVPMRDGITLDTYVHLPAGAGPFPVILTRTPNDLQNRLGSPGALAAAGYAIVLQNLRGTRQSGGNFEPFLHEMSDGADTLDWIAAQPWSNGKIGYSGASAAATAGYYAALSGSPRLTAAVLLVGHADPYHIAEYPGGVWQAHAMETWLRSLRIETLPWPRPIIRRYDDVAKAQDIHLLAGRARTAILHIGGWFDVHSQGTLDAYTLLQNQGGDRAKGNQKLIMRPLAHGGKLQSAIQYPNGEIDLAAAERRWFDYWLKGIENGTRQDPAVRYYLMGEGWRTSPAWPLATQELSYYLQPSGLLSTELPPKTASSGSFVYDPGKPIPTLGGNNLGLPSGPYDQRRVTNRPDVLRFDSNPLAAPVTIAGPVKAELFVSTNVRDTDFHVKLVDIHPDGAEILLLDRPMRLRFREGFEKMSRARANEVYPLTVELWSTAVILETGHRIGVRISSSNEPRFDRHSNTWDPVSKWEDAVQSTNTVHYSQRHPSRIILPVLPPAK